MAMGPSWIRIGLKEGMVYESRLRSVFTPEVIWPHEQGHRRPFSLMCFGHYVVRSTSTACFSGVCTDVRQAPDILVIGLDILCQPL